MGTGSSAVASNRRTRPGRLRSGVLPLSPRNPALATFSPRYTVVMTACVRPAAAFAPTLIRTDPAVRLADYREALRFWLNLPDRRVERVIFLENTGAPLGDLDEIVRRENPFGRECELCSFEANEIPPGLHYGYAEYRMLDVGLSRSRTWPKAGYLIKATGRYRFPAISHLLDRLPPDFAVAADARHNRRFLPKPQYIVTAPLWVAQNEFFEQHLRRAYLLMHPPPPHRGQFIEDALYDVLMPLRDQPGVLLRWPVNCDPAGVGANGDDYDAPRRRFLRLLRATGRRWLPHWWF